MTSPHLTLALLVVASVAGVPKTDAATPNLVPGEHTLSVPGGQIWYKVSGTGTGTPVILLHGGPGFSSFYLKPFEALGDDRIVIRYDQGGSGKSSPMSDTTLFTFARFVSELDSLRRHLGIDKVQLVGHSWGTMLAIEYYRAYPEHVAAIHFGSPVFDLPAFTAHVRGLLKTLPDSLQQQVAAAEAARTYDTPGYQAAINDYYR
jgi:proline iminopeptidase